MRKTRQKRRHMLANYAFSFPVYIHHRAHISFMRIFPSAVEKSPTVFSENRRKKWGILRIFSETPPEGICHGVILRNLLIRSFSRHFPGSSPPSPCPLLLYTGSIIAAKPHKKVPRSTQDFLPTKKHARMRSAPLMTCFSLLYLLLCCRECFAVRRPYASGSRRPGIPIRTSSSIRRSIS